VVYDGNPEDFIAMNNLMAELQDEQNRPEKSTLEAGLASSMSVLGPYYAKVAPDITLALSRPPANLDLATASAKLVLPQTMSSREKVIKSAHDQAVTTLSVVRTEHQKNGKPSKMSKSRSYYPRFNTFGISQRPSASSRFNVK
jgi:hypothetical protein